MLLDKIMSFIGRGDMDYSGYYSQNGEGELSIAGKTICSVSYLLNNNYVGHSDSQPAVKPQMRFIGELLLLSSMGEFRDVYDAAERHEKFTLRLQDESVLRVALVPDSPELGVFEILALDHSWPAEES